MIRTIARLVFPLALLCAFAAPAHADKKDDIRKLLRLTGSGDLGKQVATQLLGTFKAQNPKVPQKFWDDFAKEIKAEDLIEMVVPIYDKHLSHEDIKVVIAFYETPTGKRFVKSLPQLTQESMAAGQKWGMALAQKVVDRLQKQ